MVEWKSRGNDVPIDRKEGWCLAGGKGKCAVKEEIIMGGRLVEGRRKVINGESSLE